MVAIDGGVDVWHFFRSIVASYSYSIAAMIAACDCEPVCSVVSAGGSQSTEAVPVALLPQLLEKENSRRRGARPRASSTSSWRPPHSADRVRDAPMGSLAAM